jgi:hypothetical protein
VRKENASKKYGPPNPFWALSSAFSKINADMPQYKNLALCNEQEPRDWKKRGGSNQNSFS